MPVMPHAEPFSALGGRLGVLLLHGFTGNPASMRPWAEHLAAEEFAVEVPRLPGHGTTWQELDKTRWTDWYAEASRALDVLRDVCDEVTVAGLSMGGGLALRLAEERPDDVDALVVVNPSVASTDKRLLAIPLVKRLIGSVAGIKSDIKKAGVEEPGYDRVPLHALDSLRALWKVTSDDLPKVTAPLLVFRSVEDHVVQPRSAQLIVQRVSSRDISERILDNSFHVAVLDNDAPQIFAESVEFIRKVSSASGGPDAV